MKKEVKIILALVLFVAITGLIYFAVKTSQYKKQVAEQENILSGNGVVDQTPAAAKATQQLIDEATKKDAGKVTSITVMGATSTKEIKVVTVTPGTSAVDVNSGKVVTSEGVAVDNAARPSSKEAPHESYPITKTEVPTSAIKLDVTSSSFTPKEFTVSAGQTVSLAVSNVNKTTFSEVFRFDDPSLSAVVVGLAKGETKTITFNAPTKAGKYTFYSSMFNHRALGAVGTMTVK